MRFEWECRNLIPLPLAHAVFQKLSNIVLNFNDFVTISDLESVAWEGLNMSYI